MSDARSSRAKIQMPIFVISLARSESRRTRIAARLTELGLRFEFLDAVDGRHLTPDHQALVDFSFPTSHRLLGRPLSRGEIGCALSHALAYRKIVQENIPYAIIMEDDALPSEAFAEIVKQETLPKLSEIGLASFHYQSLFAWQRSKIPINSSVRALRPMESPLTTACYYLTQPTAAALLQAALPISGVADWPTEVHKWPTTYCISPLLVDAPPEPENSIIYSERIALMNDSTPPELETMALAYWKTPWRILGRLATLTIFPCLLWPEIFGTVDNTRRFITNVFHLIKCRLFGVRIEGGQV